MVKTETDPQALVEYFNEGVNGWPTIRDRLLAYYASFGDPATTRFGAPYLHAYPQGDRLSLDFIPEIAREGLDALLANAGINSERHDGGGGKKAYLSLSSKGLTREKLDRLGELMEADIRQRTGRDWPELVEIGEATRALCRAFEDSSKGDNTATNLRRFSEVLAGVNRLPEPFVKELQRLTQREIERVKEPGR